MQCKNCGNQVRVTLSGLNSRFCGWDCKSEWTKKRNLKNQQLRRAAVKSNTEVAITPFVTTATDGNISEKRGGFEASETTKRLIKELGGKEWYDRAKRLCCNFDVREREGFCSYLFDPKLRHTKSCSKCELGQGLLRYDSNRRGVKVGRK